MAKAVAAPRLFGDCYKYTYNDDVEKKRPEGLFGDWYKHTYDWKQEEEQRFPQYSISSSGQWNQGSSNSFTSSTSTEENTTRKVVYQDEFRPLMEGMIESQKQTVETMSKLMQGIKDVTESTSAMQEYTSLMEEQSKEISALAAQLTNLEDRVEKVAQDALILERKKPVEDLKFLIKEQETALTHQILTVAMLRPTIDNLVEKVEKLEDAVNQGNIHETSRRIFEHEASLEEIMDKIRNFEEAGKLQNQKSNKAFEVHTKMFEEQARRMDEQDSLIKQLDEQLTQFAAIDEHYTILEEHEVLLASIQNQLKQLALEVYKEPKAEVSSCLNIVQPCCAISHDDSCKDNVVPSDTSMGCIMLKPDDSLLNISESHGVLEAAPKGVSRGIIQEAYKPFDENGQYSMESMEGGSFCLPQLQACLKFLPWKNQKIKETSPEITMEKNKGRKQVWARKVWLPRGVAELVEIFHMEHLNINGKKFRPVHPIGMEKMRRAPRLGEYG